MSGVVSFSQTLGQSAVGSIHPQQTSASSSRASEWPTCVVTGMVVPASASQGVSEMLSAPVMVPAIYHRQDWLDDDERRAYMEASVEQDIAWQIASNRRARNMSQRALAELIGSKQSAVARLEDSTYGRHSIVTLVKVAHAFDCALRVTLVPYSRLAEEVEDTSDRALYAAPFGEERHLIER